jgi:hypothetical protein
MIMSAGRSTLDAVRAIAPLIDEHVDTIEASASSPKRSFARSPMRGYSACSSRALSAAMSSIQ